MPGGDRTGPLGMGPMTGRAAGYCAGYNVPGYMNPYGGRGMGLARGFRGGGGGRGFRGGFAAPAFSSPFVDPAYTGYYPAAAPAPVYNVPGAPVMDSSQELEMLKKQSDYLAAALDDVKHRIDELESGAPEKKEVEKS